MSNTSAVDSALGKDALAFNFRGTLESSGAGGLPASREIAGQRTGGSTAQSRAVREIISQASGHTKEDLAILLAIASFESRFNPQAKNPSSSAYGVFQIIDKTWSGLGYDRKERDSLVAQVEAGLALYAENLGHLRKRGLGALHGAHRLIEMYTLHHDGPSGSDAGGRALAVKHVVPLFTEFYSRLVKGN